MATEENDPQKLLAKMFEVHIAATLAAGANGNLDERAVVNRYRAILDHLRSTGGVYDRK